MIENQRITQSLKGDFAWYVLHVYPGYEDQVKQKLIHRLEIRGLLTADIQVVAPVNEPAGAARGVDYKGFLLIKIQMKKEVWKVIINTPGVVGFVGMGVKPMAFTADEWTDLTTDPFRKR